MDVEEEVTLYNHKSIGTAARPLIPNLIFKETAEALDQGDIELYELVKSEYSLETFQRQFLQSKYEEVKNKSK